MSLSFGIHFSEIPSNYLPLSDLNTVVVKPWAYKKNTQINTWDPSLCPVGECIGFFPYWEGINSPMGCHVGKSTFLKTTFLVRKCGFRDSKLHLKCKL